jgi:hypothetical protein
MDLNLSNNLNFGYDEDIVESNEKEIILEKKNYDHFKKMELVKKINKIKKKEYLINIFKIILLYSKDYTENNNGVFVFFHNLDNDVYEKIEAYVNNIYKLHKKSSGILNIYSSDFSENITSISENIQFDNDKELSNKEKLIMKRKKYEKYLDQNQEK